MASIAGATSAIHTQLDARRTFRLPGTVRSVPVASQRLDWTIAQTTQTTRAGESPDSRLGRLVKGCVMLLSVIRLCDPGVAYKGNVELGARSHQPPPTPTTAPQSPPARLLDSCPRSLSRSPPGFSVLVACGPRGGVGPSASFILQQAVAASIVPQPPCQLGWLGAPTFMWVCRDGSCLGGLTTEPARRSPPGFSALWPSSHTNYVLLRLVYIPAPLAMHQGSIQQHLSNGLEVVKLPVSALGLHAANNIPP